MKSDLIRHLEGENLGRFPVWMMRQAGRYLESYREIRKGHSFWEMVTTPVLAAKVSLLPLEVLPVDGIIFFSDILTLPYGLGYPIEMKESVGPVMSDPLRTPGAFERFQEFDPSSHVPFVGQALRQIRNVLPKEKALLGFAGAPWTVGCYLIEGRSNRHFEETKAWLYRNPKEFFQSLSSLSKATEKYIRWQVESGAEVIQLFDTWLGELPREQFLQYRDQILIPLFETIRSSGAKGIYFAKNCNHVLADFVALPADALSVDALRTLPEVEKITEKKFSLQGNLDPVLLLKADVGTVRAKTRELVNHARALSKPAILNLGHGILPTTPLENARAFIEEARTLWV